MTALKKVKGGTMVSRDKRHDVIRADFPKKHLQNVFKGGGGGNNN